MNPDGNGADQGITNSSDAYQQELGKYWKTNIKIMTVLISIWAIVGLGCGVIFADALNKINIGGFPLGFWFAQQGSIIIFVILILVYCVLLNGLDEKHHAKLSELGTDVHDLEVEDAVGIGEEDQEDTKNATDTDNDNSGETN